MNVQNFDSLQYIIWYKQKFQIGYEKEKYNTT